MLGVGSPLKSLYFAGMVLFLTGLAKAWGITCVSSCGMRVWSVLSISEDSITGVVSRAKLSEVLFYVMPELDDSGRSDSTDKGQLVKIWDVDGVELLEYRDLSEVWEID